MAVLTQSYQLLKESYLGSSGGNLYIRIYAKYSEQDIDNNRTKVQYQARAYFSGNYIYDQQSSGNVSGTSASTVSYSKSSNYTKGETTLGTTEAWVSHNSDGKKSITASAYLNFPNWDWSATASANADLPTIPRSSTITATSAYIGETSQLTITRYSTNFTHTIQYSFGSLSGYILANGSTTSAETKIDATSIGFPIPTNWYDQIPNDKEGICTLTIKTYNGNTQIGDTKTATFYARVNQSSSSPDVSCSVIDTNQTTINLTGNSNILVKGYSTAKVTWSASPRNSSSISNVKINGTAVSSNPYSFTLNDTFINVVATDSRTFSTTRNPSFTLKDYSSPNYTISARRVQPTSDYAYVSFSGTWFNQNFGSQNNALTITWWYREHGTSSWTQGGTLALNTSYKVDNNGNFWSGSGSSTSDLQLGGMLTYAKSWDIAIDVDDKLAHRSIETTITQGIPIINWESDFFNVNGDIRKENISIFKTLEPTRMQSSVFTFKKWVYLCNITFTEHMQGAFTTIRIYIGKGNNGEPNQNAYIDLSMQMGWEGSNDGRFGCLAELNKCLTPFTLENIKLKIIANDNHNYDIYFYESLEDYCVPNYIVLNNDKATITPKNQVLNSEPTGTECNIRYMYASNEVYDTSEGIIGTWLNKPLYRKVINVGSLPNNNTIRVNHNISNLGQFTKIDGVAVRSSDNDTLPIPYATFNANNSGGITIYVDDTNIVIRTTTDRSSYNGYVVLEYTKTID